MPRRPVDVFGGILEASEDELESAGVRVNTEIFEDSVRNGNTKRTKHVQPAAADGAGSSNASEATFKFPEEGSYRVEDGTPLANESDTPSNSLRLPVRTLDDFFLFEPETLSLVPITNLWEGSGSCEAFGFVLPYTESSDSDDQSQDPENEKIAFRTTAIIRFVSDVFREEITVHTEHAIYILTMPSPFYKDLYLPFYKKERILRLVVGHIYEEPDSSAAEFFDAIEDDEDPVLGRAWTHEDIGPEMKYSMEELENVLRSTEYIDWELIRDAPLLDLILAADGDQARPPPAARPEALTAKIFPKRKKTKVPLCWETTVTPLIHSFIAGHIDTAFKTVGEWPPTLNKKLFSRKRPLTRPLDEDYRPVAGDFVLVKRGHHEPSSESEDEDDPDPQFYYIAQIIHVHSPKKFHARWFVHGSATLLEEFAHGQELFLSIADKCKDVNINSVVAKYEVARISLKEHSEQKWPERNIYFYCAAWDRQNPAGFVEVTDSQVAINECYECNEDGKSSSEMTQNGAIVEGVEYHSRDFIRYKVEGSIVCSFGQVNRIVRPYHEDEVRFEVFQIGRMKDRFGSEQYTEMSLFITSSTKFVPASDVLGHVRIVHGTTYQQQLIINPEWAHKNPFIFYINAKASDLNARLSTLPPEAFQTCDICMENENRRDFDLGLCHERVLRAMDPYIGAAGFGLGLAEGCSMKTVFGIDRNPSAAETARINLSPDAKILTNDACRVLSKVVKGTLDLGNIDLIYSGPPCQNDSTLNRHKTDPTRPIFTTLSFVEALRPDFFVMECVLGYLARKTVRKVKEKRDVEEKKAGELKLTLKVLHFLGYNVSSRILNALSYGVPQTRARFFVVANHPSYGAFKFPEPTHGFKSSRGRKDAVGKLLPRLIKKRRLNKTLSTPIDLGLGTGLLETVTVEEALSDLPYFDWKLPKSQTKARPHIGEVVVQRRRTIWGIKDSRFAYTKPCSNWYQYRLRFTSKPKLEQSYQHYTKHVVTDKVVNIIDLPIVNGADYRHLEQQNLEWGLRDPASSKAILGHRGHAYTRLIPSGYFDTIVTNVDPNAKQSKIIHPYCKRILTVREFARAQGFPDSFAFYSEDDKVPDYLKQIGNSVPFNVSAALGRSIQELIFEKWKKDNNQNENEI